jgi:hypothetical protein
LAGGDAAMLRPVVLAGGDIATDAGGPPLPISAPIQFWNAARFGASDDERAAVTALVGGELAVKWEEEFDNAEIVARVDAIFRALFAAPAEVVLVASNVSRWQSDRWSRGAYSHVPPESTSADRDLLCTPDLETLYWAGEHCSSEYPSTAHGAYDSGMLAAQLARGHHPLPGKIRYEGVVAASVILTLFACGCIVVIAVLIYRRLAARKAEAAAATRVDGATPIPAVKAASARGAKPKGDSFDSP